MPDSSLNKEYIVIKKNFLKAYKEYIKEPLGKYHSSRVGLGESASKDNKLLDK